MKYIKVPKTKIHSIHLLDELNVLTEDQLKFAEVLRLQKKKKKADHAESAFVQLKENLRWDCSEHETFLFCSVLIQTCPLPHQEPDKCFECDSRHPYEPYRHRHSHRIQNVIYLMDENEDHTWWQSVNGVCVCSPTAHKDALSLLLLSSFVFKPGIFVQMFGIH